MSRTRATFVGILEGAVLRSNRILATPPVLLGVHPELGLVTALTPDDFARNRFLELNQRAALRARELRYFRDRRHLGYPVPDWFHDVAHTLIDSTGAVSSPTARVCDLKGEFLCGG